jgi:hypothetical protein
VLAPLPPSVRSVLAEEYIEELIRYFVGPVPGSGSGAAATYSDSFVGFFESCGLRALK